MPPVTRVSRALVLELPYAGMVAGAVLLFAGAFLLAAEEPLNHPSTVGGIAALVVGGLILLASWAAWLSLLHRAWSAIQDGEARTTPGKAVGFLFIPLLNIWWVFQAFHGFAQDFNRFRERHMLPCEPLNESAFQLYCICVCVSGVPYLGCLAWLGQMALMLVVGRAMVDAVNTVADAQAGGYGYDQPALP